MTAPEEKTLEAHMRDGPISNETTHQHAQPDPAAEPSTDEKQRLALEEAVNTSGSPNYNTYYPYTTHPRPEEVSSDVSSAVSFPSSYGNTSTATRETPPPPYSPPFLSPAPSRSMSVSSTHQPQIPNAITQPRPVFQPAGERSSIDEQIASMSLTPIPRPARYSWESDPR